MEWIYRQTVDLSHVAASRPASLGLFEYADSRAHQWIITLTRDDEPCELTGFSALLYVKRSDGETVIVTGDISDNVISFALPQSCYAVVGACAAIARVSDGADNIVTIASVTYTVIRRETDSIVDPAHEIPDITELMDMLDDMEAATQAALDAADGGIHWDSDYTDWDLSDDTWGAHTTQLTQATGTDLKVIAYNMGGYKFDGSKTPITELPEKLYNLRKYIAQADADVLFLTENAANIDGKNTAESNYRTGYYLFYPRYVHTGSKNGQSIITKLPVREQTKTEGGTTYYYYSIAVPRLGTYDGANTRQFRWGVMPTDAGNVLLITAHPMNTNFVFDSAPAWGPIQDRMNFMQILFDFIYCLKQQEFLTEAGLTNIPVWDYCIIGGDFNTSNKNGKNSDGEWYGTENTDWNNLKDLCDHYGFDKANGGYLGWFNTYPTYADERGSLDNILISGNALFKSIDCRRKLYDELYSDHLPLEATVTLLGAASGVNWSLPDKTYEYRNESAMDMTALKTWFLGVIGTQSASGPCIPS